MYCEHCSIYREDFSTKIVRAVLTEAMANYDCISNSLTFIINIVLNSVIKMREKQLIAFYILLRF